MATTSQFEIILSFKAVMDGLNGYVNAYRSRMAEVQAFNQRIMNGGAALQQMLGQVGALLGGAALLKYAKDAAEADRVQRQLLRTLERTGETGAVAALNAQAAALQKITHFSDEAITTVQRLLVNAGLSARQTQELTGLVLDFAQETGQSAESAAALIARTLRGQTDELGRYNLRLDTSKGKVDALREALAAFAGGAAQGAVVDPQQAAATARFADATEQLGRAVNRLLVPLQGQFIPLLEQIAKLADRLATALAPLVPVIGQVGRAFGWAILIWGAFKLASLALTQVLAPLRAAFVLLAGESLLSLNHRLAAVSARFGDLTAAGALFGRTFSSWSALFRTVAVSLSIAGAALAGWQLGSMINELEVSGLKIKEWAAIWLVAIQDKIGGAWAWMRVAWVNTRFTLLEGLTALIAFIRGKQLQLQESLNGLIERYNQFATKLGLNQASLYDTQQLRGQVDALNSTLGELESQRVAAVKAIEDERAQQLRANLELMGYIKQTGQAAAAANSAGASAPSTPGGGRQDRNSERFGLDQGELFRLQTQLLQAQLAGNQAEVDRLADVLEEKKLRQELLQLEEAAGPLIVARLKVQGDLRGKARADTAAEVAFQQRLSELEIRRADLEADRLLTAQEKQARVNALLAEQNQLILAKLALDERQLRAGVTDEEKARLLQEVAQLRKQLAENQRTQETHRPLSFAEGLRAGVTGFMDSIGTAAENAANTIRGVLGTAVNGISDGIYGWLTRTKSWGESLRAIGGGVLQQVIQGLVQIAVQELIIGRLRDLFAKKQQAEERQALGVKAVGAGLESIKQLGPIFGPIAFAASLAAIMGLAAKIGGHAAGGIVQGGKQLSWLNEEGTEAVIRAPSVRRFGPAFFEALNAGVLDLGALPDDIARQIPPAAAPSPTAGGAAAAAGGPPRIYVLMDRAAFVRAMQEDSAAWFQDMSRTFARKHT